MQCVVWILFCLCLRAIYAQDIINIDLDLVVATKAATTEEPATGVTATDSTAPGDTDITSDSPMQTAVVDEDDEDDSDLMLRPPGVLAGRLLPCDRDDPNSCNATDLDRCVLQQERDARCMCLPGFARGSDGLSCVAVKAFTVSLPVANRFSAQLYDTSSSRYRMAEYNAREAVFQAVMASELRNIAEDIQIIGFQRQGSDTDPGTMVIEANILISRAYAPERSMVMRDLQKGLDAILLPGAPDAGFFLGDTGLYVEGQMVNMTLQDPDPCSNPLLNYCSVEGGVCTRTSRSFVCACAEGYEDLSPNQLEAPGEMCIANCNCDNGGECLVNERGRRYCRCPAWYLGVHCEVNGETLLIVMCCVIGVLLLIGIITCVCCIYKVNIYRNGGYPDGSVIEEIPRSESDYRGYKVRRPYMDGGKYNTYSPSMHHPQYVSYWSNSGQQLAPVHYGGANYPAALSIPRPQTMGNY